MPDQPITPAVSQPVSIATRIGRSDASAPPQRVVDAARASLRATDAYVRLLIDRLELACHSDLVHLDTIPTAALLELTATSDALQKDAHRTLAYLGSDLASTARMCADIAYASVGTERTCLRATKPE